MICENGALLVVISILAERSFVVIIKVRSVISAFSFEGQYKL